MPTTVMRVGLACDELTSTDARGALCIYSGVIRYCETRLVTEIAYPEQKHYNSDHLSPNHPKSLQ